MLKLHALPVALLTACGAAAPRPAPAPTAGPALPPLLAAARAADGGDAWDRVQVIASKDTIEVGGMQGTVDSLEDVATGRSAQATHVGTLQQADGFDGKVSWEVTPGGEAQIYDGPDAVARARTAAWVVRRGWTRAAGAAYRELGDRDGLHGIEATPDGGQPIELWFDGDHHLARTRARQGRLTVTTDFADWRPLDGAPVLIPHRAVSDDGDARNRVTIVTTSARAQGPAPDAAFAPPRTDDRISFADGAKTSTLPFELINNHIYVHGTIDGKPALLLLDTGGANLLTPASAKRLGYTPEGAMAASGAGDGQPDLAFAHGGAVTVGGVTLAKPVFYVVDLGALPDVEGVDLDGLVGYELFTRLAVRIDYPGRKVTLTAPDAFAPPAGAIAVPFEMSDRIPVVHGTIDGLPGRFWIDTGSRVSLTTMTKFTKDHDLAGKYEPRFEAVTGWGVGGAARSAPVRFHEVTIGDAKVHDVVGDLFTGDKGALADPDAAANLGGGILSRFVVTFDYAHRTMYLEPGPDVDRPEGFDRSGLFVVRADGGKALEVKAITPGGPAEHAGVVEGDRIVAIDGAAIATRPVAEWRARLRDQPAGTKVVLKLSRGGKPAKDLAITLADLVP
jgi:predicted aspartyl protease